MRISLTTIFLVCAAVYLFADDLHYVQEIKAWYQQRLENLTQKDGWLSLAGLYWLEKGENTFGSDASNDIRFPAKADAFIGTFFYDGSTVHVVIKEPSAVICKGSTVDTLELAPDITGDPTVLEQNSLLWYVIVRGDRVGVRLKDTEHANLTEFEGLDRFPIDKSWKLQARLVQSDSLRTVKISDVTGLVINETSPGKLVFEYQMREYSLVVLGNVNDLHYFLIFADATNGDLTYGGGRYLYVPRVNEQGYTTIDFNKAYNPPCVFTPYATCPLPPSQNQLPFPVTAGEKQYTAKAH